MLNSKERNDCLYSLVYQYLAAKNQNKVYGRENSAAYEHAKGMLVGFCMAYEYRINEVQNFIQVESESGRIIVRLEK